jgi:hypothetical protein
LTTYSQHVVFGAKSCVALFSVSFVSECDMCTMTRTVTYVQ